MWPFTLSGRLWIVALVGRYPANWLIQRGAILYHRSFSHCTMRCCALMRYYQPFPAAIPLDGPGYPHVTHPSATKLQQESLRTSTPIISVAAPFDLHVLGTPPAFILSQDRTLDNNISRFHVYQFPFRFADICSSLSLERCVFFRFVSVYCSKN